jgi:hypothetical protein
MKARLMMHMREMMILVASSPRSDARHAMKGRNVLSKEVAKSRSSL